MSDTVVVAEASSTIVEVVTPGPQGPAGPVGPKGIQGDVGPQGPQGPAGPVGPQGIQGDVGPQGPAGPVGPQGIQGASGNSAYGVAVANGFVGSESDWLLSLIGPQGPQGVAGPQGQTGPTGATGATGRGISSVVRTSGTGAPGTTDTYTITYSDATTSTFGVYNGANGSGAGDMLASLYDTNADGKVNSADAADSVPWAGVTGKPSVFTPEAHAHSISDVTGLQTALDGKASTASVAVKQDALVSGTNIKTINGASILGAGDIVISGGSGGGLEQSFLLMGA